jgi:uncharacterized protein
MALDLINKVIEFLSLNSDKKYSAKEIAEWVYENNTEDCKEKLERSKSLNNEKDLIKQIAAEIYARHASGNLAKNNVKSVEGPPKKFYYTEKSDEDEITESETEKTSFSEHDLYPKLAEFLFSEFAIYSKRIDEKRSGNNKGPRGNRWLYPDVVGMEDLSKDWNQEIKDCVKQYADKKTKLWSFEVKKLINRSNIREVFFQAVSNSSWANFGYLVAVEIASDDTLAELRMLSSLHGIGFINLNVETPLDSQIMIPAREKLDIDWNSANRLAEENKDFFEYIKLVKQFYQTGEVKTSDWN